MGFGDSYHYECVKVEGNSNKVMEIYKLMAEDGKINGYTPIIIIEDEHGLMEENIKFAEEDYGSFDKFIKNCLSSYNTVDIKKFFEERKKYYEEEEKMEQQDADNLYEPSNTIYLGENVENIYIAKIPTTKPYEVFAYVPIGGFDECPDNIIHIAIAKYWYEKYGAIPVCIGNDCIQYKVEQPIKDCEKLEELSMEQYLYCGDIIWQGLESLNNLKTSLGNSTVWYFWWE